MTSEPDSVGKAVAYLLIGVAGGLGLDLCAKWILAVYTLEQFVFLRGVFGLLIFLGLTRWFGGIRALATRRWRWHLLRTVLATGSMFGFFYGLAQMPLINVMTLGFTAPLMVTALSVPLLGEQVGWRRWTGVIVGFMGVLVILRPGALPVSFAALAVIFSAFCYACLAITARHLAATETSYSMSVYVILGPLAVAAVITPQTWIDPTLNGWTLFALSGVCSAIAWIGIIGGYRRASPALLAPLEYTALIGGAIAGYLFWNEVPDRWVVVGALLIIGSGLFVVYREIGGPISFRRKKQDDNVGLPGAT